MSGFEVLSARSVDQAEEYLKEVKNIQAVWLDHYLLGKENGLDLLARLKDSPATINIPVFVVTNTASPDKLRSYLALGASKYYIKSNHRLDDIIDDIQNELTKQR